MKRYIRANTAYSKDKFQNATQAYIQICNEHPEYSEAENLAAHVFFDDGVANFFQNGIDDWQIGIFNEDEYNPKTYIYENDPYWCTEELMPGDMHDIHLTASELYNELRRLPGVDLDHLYGLRQVLDDFAEVFS